MSEASAKAEEPRSPAPTDGTKIDGLLVTALVRLRALFDILAWLASVSTLVSSAIFIHTGLSVYQSYVITAQNLQSEADERAEKVLGSQHRRTRRRHSFACLLSYLVSSSGHRDKRKP